MPKLQNFSFYPQLTNEMLKSIFDYSKFKMSFNYTINDETRVIEHDDRNGNISFINKDYWNCDDYDLNVSIKIKINNLKELFGQNGIAPLNSKVGLCIEWYSAQAKIRSVINSKEFISYADNDKNFTFDFLLPKQTFNNTVIIKALLYLAKPANQLSANEFVLNNNHGVIIGELFQKIVYMRGDGSLFPIKIMSDQGSNALWKLELDVSDPANKLVSDGITLILNTAHKDYQFIDPNSSNYCDRLATEIVSNALVMFLVELSQIPEFDLDDDYEPGTLLAYAQYCKNVLKIEFDGIENISKSVYKLIDGGE